MRSGRLTIDVRDVDVVETVSRLLERRSDLVAAIEDVDRVEHRAGNFRTDRRLLHQPQHVARVLDDVRYLRRRLDDELHAERTRKLRALAQRLDRVRPRFLARLAILLPTCEPDDVLAVEVVRKFHALLDVLETLCTLLGIRARGVVPRPAAECRAQGRDLESALVCVRNDLLAPLAAQVAREPVRRGRADLDPVVADLREGVHRVLERPNGRPAERRTVQPTVERQFQLLASFVFVIQPERWPSFIAQPLPARPCSRRATARRRLSHPSSPPPAPLPRPALHAGRRRRWRRAA